MTPRHRRVTVRLAAAVAFVSIAGLAVHASQRAADAEVQAAAAYRAATAPRPALTRIDMTAVNAALERAWHEAHVARECVELLWYAHNTLVRLWPDAPRWSMPASGCPLPPFDAIGSAREWRGELMAPPARVRAAIERARREAGPDQGSGTGAHAGAGGRR